jgi:adenylylsulfate kinase
MGLAGSGKSTIAQHVASELRANGIKTIWLDGDQLRISLGIVGHSRADRVQTGLVYLDISESLVRSGYTVLLSSIGMLREYENVGRKLGIRFVEVLIKSEIENLTRSRVRDFYVDDAKNVMGLDNRSKSLQDLVNEFTYWYLSKEKI